MHGSRQQSLIAEWLGPSVTGRVRVRARAKEWDFPGGWDFSLLFFFFFSVLKCDKQLCLALLARCRCTLSSKNYDVKMM